MRLVEFDTSVLIGQQVNACIELVDRFNVSLQKAIRNTSDMSARILIIKAGFDPDLAEDLACLNAKEQKIKFRVSVKKFLKIDGNYDYASSLCADYNINRINVYTVVDRDGNEIVDKILARG